MLEWCFACRYHWWSWLRVWFLCSHSPLMYSKYIIDIYTLCGWSWCLTDACFCPFTPWNDVGVHDRSSWIRLPDDVSNSLSLRRFKVVFIVLTGSLQYPKNELKTGPWNPKHEIGPDICVMFVDSSTPELESWKRGRGVLRPVPYLWSHSSKKPALISLLKWICTQVPPSWSMNQYESALP